MKIGLVFLLALLISVGDLLAAFPTILVNSATGSDTAASGAGPGTALTGTAATSNVGGTVVTLDGSPDLSGVATDGSAALYLHETVAGRRCFAKITAVDNGADTVTVAEAVRASIPGGDSIDWAIGGKRDSIGNSQSKKLFDNNSGNGDAMPGWIVEMESGHTETLSSRLDWYRAGDTTSGPMIWRGASGAATRPVVTMSASDIVNRGAYHWMKDFDIVGSGGATACIIDTVSSSPNRFEGLKISGFSGVLIEGASSLGLQQGIVVGCNFNGGSIGVRAKGNTRIIGNRFKDQTSHAIASEASAVISGLVIYKNLITGSGGDGINLSQGRTDSFGSALIADNTIDDSTSDGIQYAGDYDSLGGFSIINNILSNNGGYGALFSSIAAESLSARSILIKNNNTYNNTSGAYSPSSIGENDPGLDPTFTNTGSDDYSIGTNLKAQGYPEGVIGFSATSNYGDIGTAQRQESSGGGTKSYTFVQ